MLKITKTDDRNGISIKLEGSIRGPWVSELENAWRPLLQDRVKIPIRVDLSSVRFADLGGRSVLKEMTNSGAILVGASMFMHYLLNETPDDSNTVDRQEKEH